MNRAIEKMLVFIAICACALFACTGGELETSLRYGSGYDTTGVEILVRSTTSATPAISYDAVAEGGGGVGGADTPIELEEILDEAGSAADYDVEPFTSPSGLVQVFQASSGFTCAENAADIGSCIDCEVTHEVGVDSLICSGTVPNTDAVAAESVVIRVNFYARFKSSMQATNGALGVKALVEQWMEIELEDADASNSLANSTGVDLAGCAGEGDYMKADLTHASSFAELVDDGWQFLAMVTDVGSDADGDFLTTCDVHTWIDSSVSLAGIAAGGTVYWIKGPINFESGLYENMEDCPWY